MRDTEDSCPDSDCESVADSEDEYVLDYGEFLQTMEVDETRDVQGKRGFVPMLGPVPSHNPCSLKRPRRTNQEKRCLAVFLEVTRYKAFTLCDSGCTTKLISHDFAHLVRPKLFELDEPITIQLGTKGSRSQIIYGTFAPFSFNSGKIAIAGRKYFNIANVDCYDIVVGTSFMRRHMPWRNPFKQRQDYFRCAQGRIVTRNCLRRMFLGCVSNGWSAAQTYLPALQRNCHR